MLQKYFKNVKHQTFSAFFYLFLRHFRCYSVPLRTNPLPVSLLLALHAKSPFRATYRKSGLVRHWFCNLLFLALGIVKTGLASDLA